ncbi:MAG: YraN family protein [Solirubrobacterales bacterium]
MKKATGDRGEALAADYLERRGYTIVCRNYRTRQGEIDIICQERDVLVFVEVRTKTNNRFGEPEESMTPRKIQRIRTTALTYLDQTEKRPRNGIRFDFIGIRLDSTEPRINHIKGAF